MVSQLYIGSLWYFVNCFPECFLNICLTKTYNKVIHPTLKRETLALSKFSKFSKSKREKKITFEGLIQD